MSIVDRVVAMVVAELRADGRLLFYPGADVDAVQARVVARVHAAPNHAHIGRVLLDALAADAVRLSNYYVHPTCSPTRAALMTGKTVPSFIQRIQRI